MDAEADVTEGYASMGRQASAVLVMGFRVNVGPYRRIDVMVFWMPIDWRYPAYRTLLSRSEGAVRQAISDCSNADGARGLCDCIEARVSLLAIAVVEETEEGCVGFSNRAGGLIDEAGSADGTFWRVVALANI